MTAKMALRFTALMTGVHAAILIVSPNWMLSLFDAPGGDDIDFWLRRYGVVFAAITVVFWFAADFSSSMMQRPILWSAALLAVAMATLSVIGIVDERVNPAFWTVAGYEFFLAAWFGWLLSTERV
ncbi:MAG: hypothetical protein V3U50_07045 [Acidimicrobiia bacterium]